MQESKNENNELNKVIEKLKEEGKVNEYKLIHDPDIISKEETEELKDAFKPKVEYAVNYIPFIDFLKLYNFRSIHPTSTSNDLNDTKIIRIIYGDIFNESYNAEKFHWFEFGIYDFGSTRDFVKSLNKIFSKEILNSYVYNYCVNEESGTFEIWLTNEPGDEYDD